MTVTFTLHQPSRHPRLSKITVGLYADDAGNKYRIATLRLGYQAYAQLCDKLGLDVEPEAALPVRADGGLDREITTDAAVLMGALTDVSRRHAAQDRVDHFNTELKVGAEVHYLLNLGGKPWPGRLASPAFIVGGRPAVWVDGYASPISLDMVFGHGAT